MAKRKKTVPDSRPLTAASKAAPDGRPLTAASGEPSPKKFPSPFASLAKNIDPQVRDKILANVAKPTSGKTEAAEPVVEKDPVKFAPKVVARREKKGRRGKTVVVIEGVLEGREILSKRLKKALGQGAKIEGNNIVALGGDVDRVVAFLEGAGAKRVVRGS